MNKFSLLVATLNRHQELSKLLGSLTASSLQDFELIIVDQSDDKDFSANAKLVSESSIVGARHIRDRGRGLSRARNIAIRESSGRILCFPDDDCWYPEDLLYRIEKYLVRSGYDFICGSYKEPAMVIPFGGEKWSKMSWLFPNTEGVSSVGIFLDTERVSRINIEFDEALGAGTSVPAGEEKDLVLSLIKSGHKGVRDSTFCVFHPVLRPSVSANAIRGRTVARSYVFTKHAAIPACSIRLVFGLLRSFILSVRAEEKELFLARIRGIKLALVSEK